jgi:DNA polymerase elongation subunit (family B)
MKFYTSVNLVRNNILLRGYDDGKRVQESIPYNPFLFISSQKKNTKYRTLDGDPVDRIDFDSPAEARDFLKTYKDVNGMTVYGFDRFQYSYIFEQYPGEIQYDPELINVLNIDIETPTDQGFPDMQKAEVPVTAITMKCRDEYIVLGLQEYESKDPKVKYILCKDEYALLSNFIKVWNMPSWNPDIVTGWNIEFFDIPYLVNRITKLFGEREAKKLSPWGILEEHEIENRGRKQQAFRPMGVAVLDYVQLYKKHTYVKQETYKLDYIAQVELGEKKLDYSDYDSLYDLYIKNHTKFIDYNIHDVKLVSMLDDKLKLFELVYALAYDAKVNYEDTFASVKPWDVIIHNYLLSDKIVIPQFDMRAPDRDLAGGYVKEPKPGLYKWVVSFDLNSLYPHLIMQYNISPDTFVTRLMHDFSIDELLNGALDDIRDEFESRNCAIAANLCLYDKKKKGFLPKLMQKMYDDRVVYKKKMLESKKEYEATKSVQASKDVARYHNMQQAKKIQLNSAYGALGNQYFRWFDMNHAEAITLSGQLSIRWMANKMNGYLNKLFKTKGEDYVIACDTDSMYVNFDKLVQLVFAGRSEAPSDLEITRYMDKVCQEKIEPFIDSCYQELSVYVNAYDQKMKMKREAISNKGVWTAKKRYILNVYNLEGVEYATPKLKMQGIEAVRSSTPSVVRTAIHDSLEIIMNKDEKTLHSFIDDFRHTFRTLPFDEVAFPRGCNGLSKYKDSAQIYKKGTPIQVKGALLFNDFLEKKGLSKKYSPIYEGDKIKFAYLKMPNPLHNPVVSVPDELPKQLGLHNYVDYDMQFEKSFLDPIRTILDAIGWHHEETITIEDFF